MAKCQFCVLPPANGHLHIEPFSAITSLASYGDFDSHSGTSSSKLNAPPWLP